VAVVQAERTCRTTIDRVKGFGAAVRRLGGSLHEDHVLTGPSAVPGGHSRTLEFGYRVHELMRGRFPPTALFAVSDVVAIGACRRLLELGYRIPEDVSLVGFDDIELSAFVYPPLTTVRQDKAAIAQEAVAALEQLMGGEKVKAREALVEPRLVVRASTAPPRG
jgi:LacI family repressor for deo operon, udp, cdd, tsx, nupC, and nupG